MFRRVALIVETNHSLLKSVYIDSRRFLGAKNHQLSLFQEQGSTLPSGANTIGSSGLLLNPLGFYLGRDREMREKELRP